MNEGNYNSKSIIGGIGHSVNLIVKTREFVKNNGSCNNNLLTRFRQTSYRGSRQSKAFYWNELGDRLRSASRPVEMEAERGNRSVLRTRDSGAWCDGAKYEPRSQRIGAVGRKPASAQRSGHDN